MSKKDRDFSYLQTPAVRTKRAKAIRAAFRKKKAASKGGVLALPAVLAEGERPLIEYEGLAPKRAYRKSSEEHERLEIAKGFIATVALIMGKGK